MKKRILYAALISFIAILSVFIVGTLNSDNTAEANSFRTVKQIKKSGELRVATGIYVPFEYKNKHNKMVGYDIDFAHKLAKKLKVKLVVKDMDFTAIIPSIQKGNYDLAIAALYDTPQRRQLVNMSKSYLGTGIVLVSKKGGTHQAKTWKDLSGLKVGVKTGSTSEATVKTMMKKYNFTCDLVEYDDTVPEISDLQAGRIDIGVNDYLNQKQLSKKYKGVKITSKKLTKAHLSVATQKGNKSLLKFVNKQIKDYKQSGLQKKLYNKWIQ